MGPFSNDVFFSYFIFSLLATMVGGLQSLPGTAIGGLVLGLADQYDRCERFYARQSVHLGAIVALAVTRRSSLSRWPMFVGLAGVSLRMRRRTGVSPGCSH